MADDAQHRNLPATERRIRRAREDGQVARSRDLGHFAALAVGGALLVVFGPLMARWVRELLLAGLRFDATTLARPGLMTERLADLMVRWLMVAVPFGAALMAVAAASAVISGGWNWTMKPLAPNFGRFNPLAGLGRMFSKQQLIEALKATALAGVLFWIGAAYLQRHWGEFAQTLEMPLPAAAAKTGDLLRGGLVLLVLLLALFAVIDVPLQRWLYQNRLKMSAAEAKQEHKEVEGNTQVKAKVRARMREMVKRRMLSAVPGADLVVMNPTHYAVALKYEEGRMTAPKVVAKGADLLALKIRDVAKGAKVPVLQAPVLARALYAHAELDREIPAVLFAAVAQVLAYVYQLKAAMAGHGQAPTELPELNVPPELDPHQPKAMKPTAQDDVTDL